MSCRGVLFAIDDRTVRALLDAESDDEVMESVESIEEDWDVAHLAEVDKAWDAMHRLLSDGSLDPTKGEYPLNHAILGGEHLHDGDDYIVVLVRAEQVRDVARALAAIDEVTFRDRYARLVPKDYAPEHGDEDLAYTWDWFTKVVALYASAAKARRAVIFTVDQ